MDQTNIASTAPVAQTEPCLEFWFDLSSPYAYFAAIDIEAVVQAHGRRVAWRPFLLGVAYQTTGMKALPDQPLRGDYALRDWSRLARLKRVPFKLPARFPMRTQGAARMVYAAEQHEPDAAGSLAQLFLGAAFGSGRQIDHSKTPAQIAARAGFDGDLLLSAASDPHWKDVLRSRCDEAVQRGIFGSPFIIVDDEPFWGADRLPMVDRWLARGGW
jgi:2-hydroxychromene-2-carboxylate isomerase